MAKAHGRHSWSFRTSPRQIGIEELAIQHKLAEVPACPSGGWYPSLVRANTQNAIEILSGLLSGPPWIFWGQTVRQSVIPKKGKIFGEKCVELACQHDLGKVCGQHSLGFRQNKLFIGCHQWFTVATFHWFWYCKVVVACTFWVYSLEHFRTMSTQNLS